MVHERRLVIFQENLISDELFSHFSVCSLLYLAQSYDSSIRIINGPAMVRDPAGNGVFISASNISSRVEHRAYPLST